MTLKQIAALGRKLSTFLALFSDCFGRREARDLLRAYVKGQLSNLRRKTAEAIALQFKTAPRTLQRFLESIKWDEEKLRDRCQQIVAKDHAHPEAIGCVDESGTAKSGKDRDCSIITGDFTHCTNKKPSGFGGDSSRRGECPLALREHKT